MTFLIPSTVCLPLSLSVCLSLPVSLYPSFCVSACLCEQQSTPRHPPKRIQILHDTPSSNTRVWAKLL